MKPLILSLLSFLFVSQAAVSDEAAVSDSGLTMSEKELSFIVRNWSPAMQSAAASSDADRFELLNKEFASKKVAADATAMPLDPNSDAYWRRHFVIQKALHTFYVQEFLNDLVVPDMRPLAQERYDTQREKYAQVPEKRSSSHILLLCPQGACDPSTREAEAGELLQQLKDGADFEELASSESEDPGGRLQRGKFPRWVAAADREVARPYREALFGLEETGNYSNIVYSQFGLHIIRLDGIQDAHEKSFKEVERTIIQDLAKEYRDLQIRAFDEQYLFTDEVRINGEVMERIFSPYKTLSSAN